MSDAADPSILRRKLSTPSPVMDDGSPTVPRALQLAFCKSADKFLNLVLSINPKQEVSCGLSDLQEAADESDLLFCLRTPEGTLGLAMVDVQLRAGLIEMQTMGKIVRAEATSRSVTRTDAKLIEPNLGALLEEFDQSMAPFDNRKWAVGYRPSLMLEGPRLIGLVLEDVRYKLFEFDVDMSIGSKKGKLKIAMVQGRRAEEVEAEFNKPPSPEFAELLEASLEHATADLSAVLDVLNMSVSDVSKLEKDQVLKISPTALQSVRLQGSDGNVVARGALGEENGILAVRLTSASLPASKSIGTATGFEVPAAPDTLGSDPVTAPLAPRDAPPPPIEDVLPELPADFGPDMGTNDLSDLPGMSEDALDEEFDFAQMAMPDLPEIAS